VSLANGSRTVFIRNLPWSASEDDLRSYLADAGPIYEVRIAVDYDGRPKGFAHVQFESEEGAAAAIQMTGGYVGDREVHIETTTERQQSTCSIYVHYELVACFFRWKQVNVLPHLLLFCVGYPCFHAIA